MIGYFQKYKVMIDELRIIKEDHWNSNETEYWIRIGKKDKAISVDIV